jgi:predicted Zn-dependent protease
MSQPTTPRAIVLAAALIVGACATSPTGRNQLILFPENEMAEMGAAAFQNIQTETPVTKNASVNRYVTCVSEHIIRTLPNGNPSEWEIKVFDQDAANAFALPGRKIGVYTGLLDVAENQSQLATVIGHEVGHVLAKHSNERVSTNFVTQSGLQLAQVAVGGNTPMRQELFGLLGVGAQYGVLLPFGRAQEAEADLVGLDIMARAGFDPRESVKLWQNMQAQQGGDAPPEFMSTHPSSERRIAELNARVPEHMQLSLQARNQGRVPDCK